MLLNSFEHLAYRVAGLSAVVYGLEKTNILNSLIGDNQSDIALAVKTSAILSGSEFLSDYLLSIVTNVKVPSLYHTVSRFGIAFVVNAIVLYAMDKLNIDEMIVKRNASDEMKAVEIGVLFVIVQEITYKLLEMYIRGSY